PAPGTGWARPVGPGCWTGSRSAGWSSRSPGCTPNWRAESPPVATGGLLPRPLPVRRPAGHNDYLSRPGWGTTAPTEAGMRSVLTVILAGGKGTRLEPLTRDRAKPAVPFGGLYRIVDFTLSNCINSGLRKVLVLTQFKSRSLDRHLRSGWNFLSGELGEYVEVLPQQQRIDEHWYKGTADAI